MIKKSKGPKKKKVEYSLTVLDRKTKQKLYIVNFSFRLGADEEKRRTFAASMVQKEHDTIKALFECKWLRKPTQKNKKRQ